MSRVRQMRGPGMNKGLKKPRHAKFPSTAKSPSKRGSSSSSRKDYKKGASGSYLSDGLAHRLWGTD